MYTNGASYYDVSKQPYDIFWDSFHQKDMVLLYLGGAVPAAAISSDVGMDD